jgi:K+-transporting ATPase A subunit
MPFLILFVVFCFMVIVMAIILQTITTFFSSHPRIEKGFNELYSKLSGDSWFGDLILKTLFLCVIFIGIPIGLLLFLIFLLQTCCPLDPSGH